MTATHELVMPHDPARAVEFTLPIQIEGVVIEGDHRGRELGYPTANVAMPADLSVPEGVFAGIVRRANGTTHLSAISVGRRETFYGPNGVNLIEAFLLDFSGDLYGERLTVSLLALLRGQLQFSSIPELITQIEFDVESVRLLAQTDTPRGA